MKGYTLNGLSVGGTWTELQASVAEGFEVEKVDWRYQVSDPKSKAGFWSPSTIRVKS